MGAALANYCLSAWINLNSPHKRCTHSTVKRAQTGPNWHTWLIKEVTMQSVKVEELLDHRRLLICLFKIYFTGKVDSETM